MRGLVLYLYTPTLCYLQIAYSVYHVDYDCFVAWRVHHSCSPRANHSRYVLSLGATRRRDSDLRRRRMGASSSAARCQVRNGVTQARGYQSVRPNLVPCPNVVVLARTTVCGAGRPATRYRAARKPLPRVPIAFQGWPCVRGEPHR